MPTPSPVPDTDAPTPGTVPSLVAGGSAPSPAAPPSVGPSLPGGVVAPPPEVMPEVPVQPPAGFLPSTKADTDAGNIPARTWRAALNGGGDGYFAVRHPLAVAQRCHVILYGQSNASGSDAVPVLTTTAVYDALRFSTGVRGAGGGGVTAVSLLESTDDTQGETPCSGVALQWTESGTTDGAARLILSAVGYGGYGINQLVKGTAPYTDLLSRASHARTLSGGAGVSHAVAAVVWVQGESDGAMAQATYLEKLLDLREDLQADLRSQVLGGGEDFLHLPMVQPSAHINAGGGPALAQLEAAVRSPYHHLVAPAYALPHANNIHYSALGAQMAGRAAGRALRELAEHGDARTLMPMGASSRGREIIWFWDVPVPPLLLDSSALPPTPSHGFQVEDEDGMVPISSIEVMEDRVRIVVARDLEGDTEVRYALDNNGTGIINGASGNLRDSTADAFWIDGVSHLLPRAAPHAKRSVKHLRHDAADVILPGEVPLEEDAFDHWQFGTDSSSLTGLVNSEVLTRAGVLAATYEESSIILHKDDPGSHLQGLVSTMPDGIEQTILVVLRVPTEVVGGTYQIIAGTADPFTGSGLTIDFAGHIKFSNTLNAFNLPFTSAMNGGETGAWICLVFREGAGKFGLLLSGVGNREFHDYTTGTKDPVERNVGIGNCYANYSNCNDADLEFAELVLWNRRLSVRECIDALTRSRMRMAQRGVFF
ncbi:hypothetical protein OVA24_06220 [Luteolibacter sp. SL250]|uniref:sialate O-acetylesterase n=1 Tax=Luteolibacter sp. SL250 TaxID=2995170 RepID=UPI002270898E|nr:sialate O-acetylesterase [Luteolibacter sp. SL250]WAC20976.1 hypothetical protein OVA24_06220 [Luteolibacter sp. SL250]